MPLGKRPAYPYTTSIILLAKSPTEGVKKEFCFEVSQRRRIYCARLRGKAVRVRVPKEYFEQKVRTYYEESISIEEVGEPDGTSNDSMTPAFQSKSLLRRG